jgi:hypothetical protein
LAISILCLVLISVLFIPNVILTTLKYRSGVLPSLRSKNFKYYRTNLTFLTFLVPSVFWSALAMVFVIFGVICILSLAFFLPVCATSSFLLSVLFIPLTFVPASHQSTLQLMLHGIAIIIGEWNIFDVKHKFNCLFAAHTPHQIICSSSILTWMQNVCL